MQVELKQFSEKHIPALCELLNNENVSKWLLQVPFPYTLQDAEVWINKCKDHPENKTDFVFAIEKDGLLIGGIGLHNKSGHSAEVGYWLGEKYWGNGYITEAIKEITDYGFKELSLVRITAHVFEGNIRSEKVLLKNGFEYEGLLKKNNKKGEIYLNTKLYAKVI